MTDELWKDIRRMDDASRERWAEDHWDYVVEQLGALEEDPRESEGFKDNQWDPTEDDYDPTPDDYYDAPLDGNDDDYMEEV